MTFDGAHRPDDWTAAAGVELTDRIRFVRTFPGGYQFDADLLVLGAVSMSHRRRRWSPAP